MRSYRRFYPKAFCCRVCCSISDVPCLAKDAKPKDAIVVTQVLGHRQVKFPTPRSTGRLHFWDHLGDQISHILCPSGEAFDNRGSLPAKLPPGVNIDDVAGPTPLPRTWDKKMKAEDAKEKEPNDLDIPLIDLEKETAGAGF